MAQISVNPQSVERPLVGSSSTSVYNTSVFWERLWRSAGIQSIGLFIIGYFIYGSQPQTGASADVLDAFYHGHRTLILIAAVEFITREEEMRHA